MTPRLPATGWRGAGVGAATVLAVSVACTRRTPSVVGSRGPAERGVVGLWWWMLGVSSLVFILVMAMMVAAVVRSRRHASEVSQAEPRWAEPFIAGVGVVFASVALVATFVLSIRIMRANADQGRHTAFTVTVVGHDWWWEVRYPGGAVTANELRIPVGERIRLVLRSADVIHSFWVPQLAPKTDLVPGRTNVMWLEASAPGRYRGECAEYCGLQHANMVFEVIATSRPAFEAWERLVAQPALPPRSERARAGERVFLESTCAGCHTIRGTPARGEAGPDLTHLALRSTIGAGVLPNTRANLTSWVADPQPFKPGVAMPPAPLSSADLDVLVEFLEGLR